MRTDKLKITVSKRKMYHKYIKYVKKNKLGDKYLISQELYSNILNMIHLKIKDAILKNIVFKMPHLGYRIKIIKRKINPLDKDGNFIPYSFPVDWKETRALWKANPQLKNKKLIYHLNDHTDGHIYRIRMFPSAKVHWHTKFYKFSAAEPFKRELSRILKDPYNKQDYYEL
jgi:hypothetical protein